jgi:phosphate transport system protein
MGRDVERGLDELRGQVQRMGRAAQAILEKALRAVWERDAALAREVKIDDLELDRLELEIDEAVLRLLALQAPKADDLRGVVALKSVTADLERVGDLSRNVAQSALRLAQQEGGDVPAALRTLAGYARSLLARALESLEERDCERAEDVVRDDEEADRSEAEVVRGAIAQISADPALTSRGVDYILIAKSLERVADHATNIGEGVVLAESARNVKHAGKLAL